MEKQPKPTILQPGDISCIHYEQIENLVGTCRKCGRVKQYPGGEFSGQHFQVREGVTYNDRMSTPNFKWGQPK
jgi:hypothetical protein